MTTAEPAPEAPPATARIEAIEIVGLRLLGVWVLAWTAIDGAYLLTRFFLVSYPSDIADIAWVATAACVGWLLMTRAPRIARWLRARTRVDSPA